MAVALDSARPKLRLLSLGAGVQSTTLLLLTCDGEIARFDYALFADTGWEPRVVYKQLTRATRIAKRAGIPVRIVSAGDIRAEPLDMNRRFVSMPLHVRNPDGSKGMSRRQCTGEYKIKPLKAAARRLLGYPYKRPAGTYGSRSGFSSRTAAEDWGWSRRP